MGATISARDVSLMQMETESAPLPVTLSMFSIHVAAMYPVAPSLQRHTRFKCEPCQVARANHERHPLRPLGGLGSYVLQLHTTDYTFV